MSSSSVSLGRNLVSLKWEDFNMFVVSELAALYQKDDLTDVTLFCEGRSFRAHKVLLSLWSTYFRDVFRSTTHSHPVVILRETNSSDLELILRFIYQGHLLIPIEETDRFLKAAEHFQVAGLKNMRTHVPNFSYPSSSSSNVSSFQDETSPHPQQVHTNIYDGPSSVASSGLASPPTAHSQQSSSHFSRGGGSSSGGSIHVTSGVTVMNNMPPPPAPPLPPQSQQTEPASHHLPPPTAENASNQQQVIRQGNSARLQKHVPAGAVVQPPPPSSSTAYSSQAVTGFSPGSVASGALPTSSASSSGGQVQVVTRVAPESVIYHQQQPQQVVIFPNGAPSQSTPGAVYMKNEGVSQYITRGESGRQEMMVVQSIEGDVGISAVHIEAATSNSHSTTTPTSSYTVYAHSSTSPIPTHSTTHHSSPEVSGSEEAILGLPYDASPNHHALHREVTTVEISHHHPPPPAHHSQSQHHSQHQHASDSRSMDVDPPPPQTVVITHPYTSTSSQSSFEPTMANGNGNTSSSSAESSPTSKVKPASALTISEAPPVYAVKRIPPPLPPSSPPLASPTRNYKNPSTIKRNVSSPKKSPAYTTASGQQHHQSNSSATNVIGTRSRSTGDVKHFTASRAHQPGTKVENAGDFPSTSQGTTTIQTSRKVVLVNCPKCGKKVKQTSLKVHMKRTHLEEGTVLVCPICSKRISSKGVYYKHMYIHRKRSEADTSQSSTTSSSSSTGGTSTAATAASLIKNETQGT